MTARGLVGGMQTLVRGKKEPSHDLAHAIVERCMWKGLLLFSPVGAWGQTVKIAPPLSVTREALEEGLTVLAEATGNPLRPDPGGAPAQGVVQRGAQRQVNQQLLRTIGQYYALYRTENCHSPRNMEEFLAYLNSDANARPETPAGVHQTTTTPEPLPAVPFKTDVIWSPSTNG